MINTKNRGPSQTQIPSINLFTANRPLAPLVFEDPSPSPVPKFNRKAQKKKSTYNCEPGLEGMADDLDSSFDFQEETVQQQNLFENKGNFSYLVLFIYIGYIYSFILENRSKDLEGMNSSIEPLIKDRLNLYTTHSMKKYEDVISMSDAYNYMLDRLHFIYLDIEPKSDRTYNKSILAYYPPNHYNYMHLNFLQSFNILEGARVRILAQGNKKFERYFNATLDEKAFYSEIFKLIRSIDYQNNKIKVSRFQSLQFDLIYYNNNLETSIYYEFDFNLNLQEGFTKDFRKIMFLPRFNDSSSKYYSPQRIVWLIRTIYFIFLMIFSLKVIFGDFYRFMKQLIVHKQFQLNWTFFLNIVYIVLSVKYFVQYYQLMMNKLLYNGRPISNEEAYNDWITLAEKQKQIYRYTGFLTIFLIIRLMGLIQTKFFESLRIVFYAFAATRNLIIAYFLAVSLILIGFLAYSSLVLVEYERSFTDFYKTFEIIALNIFEDYTYPQSSLVEYLDNSFITPIFFFAMFIIFNTFALQFFIAIIVSSYSVMRKKYQNALEALVDLKRRQESSLSQKIYSTLTFKTYSKFDHENNLNQELNSTGSEEEDKDLDNVDISPKNLDVSQFTEDSSTFQYKQQTDADKVKLYQTKKKEKKLRFNSKKVETKNLRQILRDNYEQLFNMHNETEFMSRDQHLLLVKKLKGKIKRRKLKRLEQQSIELKNDKVSNFGKFLVYIIFIVLFLVSVSRHITISDRYKVYTSIRDELRENSIDVPNSSEPINFYQIQTLSDFNSWIKNFTASFKEHRENKAFKTMAQYNYHLSFLTGKFFYSKTSLQDVIFKTDEPKYRSSDLGTVKVQNSTVVHYLTVDDQSIQKINIFDQETRIKLNYSSEYDGIVFYTSIEQIPDENLIKYISTDQFLDIFSRQEIVDIDNVKTGLETIFVNLNRQLITYIEFIMSVQSTGEITPRIKINTLKMNPYDISFFSFLGEIIWLIIFINLIYMIFKMLSAIYNRPKLRAITECHEKFRNKDFFSQFLNIHVEEISSLSQGFFRILNRIYKTFKRVFTMIKIFSQTKTLYLFQIISLLLSVIAITLWFRIIVFSYDPRLTVDYMLMKKTGDKEREILILMRDLASYIVYYRKVQGINAIFLVCGIFPYFSFSLKLSVVLHVIQLARKDLISYIIIFLTIVFGFGVGGYMIYGDKLEIFNSVLRASLEIILMTIGGVQYELLKSAEPRVTPIFVFTYLILAYIIFLKMFIVILDATYKDLINYVAKENITFLAYLNSLVMGVIENIDVYMRGRSNEEIKQKYLNKDGVFSGLKLYFELFYNNFIKKLQEKLWLLIKAVFLMKDKEYRMDQNQQQEQVEMHDRSELYKGLRKPFGIKKISLETVDRFSTFQSLKGFLSIYHSEQGLKGDIGKAEKTNNKEDIYMNEWFNNLNGYIENATQNKYSLRKIYNEAGKNDLKKDLLFTLLNLSSIINFREKNLIDKNLKLKELCAFLKNKIKIEFGVLKKKIVTKKQSSQTEKNRRAEYNSKLAIKENVDPNEIKQSQISMNPSEFPDTNKQSELKDPHDEDSEISEDIDLSNQCQQNKLMADYLKLMLYQIIRYIEFKNNNLHSTVKPKEFSTEHESKFSKLDRLRSYYDFDQELMAMDDIELAENLEPITIYKAINEIASNEQKLENLYYVWREIPKSLRYGLWADNKNSEFLTINQKIFLLFSVPLQLELKNEFYKFSDLNCLLCFIKLVKPKKFKVDRKALNFFLYKEEPVFEINGSNYSQVFVRFKSEDQKKGDDRQVTDYEFIIKLIGIKFFQKIGKCKNQTDRLKICLKNVIVSKVEYLTMWFVLSLEDRLKILMMIKGEALYNILSATITGEIIFGDLVNSILSVNYLNDSIKKQMFDLFLVNSQNKATDISLENNEKSRQDQYSDAKLQEYSNFLKNTEQKIITSMAIYEKQINSHIKNGHEDLMQAFLAAANRYSEIRGMDDLDFKELLQSENDKIMTASNIHFMQGSKVRKSIQQRFEKSPMYEKFGKEGNKSSKKNISPIENEPLETEQRGLVEVAGFDDGIPEESQDSQMFEHKLVNRAIEVTGKKSKLGTQKPKSNIVESILLDK